jgi:hypothetical protein
MADSICWFKLAEDVVVPEESVLSDVAEAAAVEELVVEESVDGTLMPLALRVVSIAFLMIVRKSVVSPDDSAVCRAERIADWICVFKPS